MNEDFRLPRNPRERFFYEEWVKAKKAAESFQWYCFGAGFSVGALLFGILTAIKDYF